MTKTFKQYITEAEVKNPQPKGPDLNVGDEVEVQTPGSKTKIKGEVEKQLKSTGVFWLRDAGGKLHTMSVRTDHVKVIKRANDKSDRNRTA